MQDRNVDVAILGAGTAGLTARRAADEAGASTLLIDPGPLGTTCARIGCLPSKLLVGTAAAAHAVEEADRFGVKAMYVFGSTKNATAGPGSDIDLLIHFTGGEEHRAELLAWLEGWSLCLAEINYLRTGYRSEGLLDAHLVTDEDIEARTSYAVKIGAVTDAAREIPLGKRPRRGA